MEQIASNRIACQRLLGKTRGRGSRMSHDRAVLLTTPKPKGVDRGCLATEPSSLQRLLGNTIGGQTAMRAKL